MAGRAASGAAPAVRGGRPLAGHATISGAKNSALALMAAALLARGPVDLHNVPNLADVEVMARILRSLGARASYAPARSPTASGCLSVDATALASAAPPAHEAARLRASFLVIGPLLARLGEARVPLPGGCDIGSRPVDLHVASLRALGAHVDVDLVGREVRARLPAGGLRGARVALRYPSVGATETTMMAAAAARGTTVIANAAREPEIEDLARLLTAMGARVAGAGTRTVTVDGVAGGPTTDAHRGLSSAELRIIPDRIEAGTFLVAAAATGSPRLDVSPVVRGHIRPLTDALERMGCIVAMRGESVVGIRCPRDPARLRGVEIDTGPFPGFPTDMQPQVMALMALAGSPSVLRETVFEARMRHAAELVRMGAEIAVEAEGVARIAGGARLRGGCVAAGDLRAGAGLVIAGMAAEGETLVGGVEHIDRGYERLDAKLAALGVDVRRVTVQ
ncbi:unnamed protein product [Pedinophyceae sp. YPF-701]|nr:unnamed protein product [Pedinophyceae sp. YPF-701]